MEISREDFRRLITFIGALVVVLTLFVGMKTINEIKRFEYIGAGSLDNTSTVTVSGEGEVFATADIATFSYSVVEQGDTAAEAEDLATEKWNNVLSYLEETGVEEEDIKTTNYAISPVYETLPPNTPYVPLDEREIVGYTVTQSAQVKVRDTEQTGDILSGVGEFGVRNLSGISFTIDDESDLKEEARDIAIANAREKAEELADSLEVTLGDVVSYNENQNGGPIPFYREQMMSMDAAAESAASPEIPMGENRIVVNVDVTYRIR